MKISWEEYRKLSLMIVAIMKDFERAGMENVVQAEVINGMVRKIEIESPDVSTSVEQSIETSKKVANVISYLIAKENLLMVSQDSKIKNERYLCLNINADLANMNLGTD